jgi:pyridoxine kinase
MAVSIISIQSQVVFGHVGNSAAVLPMQLAGLDVAPVPTTLLSNHPRYRTTRGKVLDAQLVADLLVGVEERGLVESARFIVTGYLGSAENGAVVADFVARAKARNPALAYVCDPVIGDAEKGVFVREGVVELIRGRLVPMADVLTPNDFEFDLLAGAPSRTGDEMLAAAARWPGGAPRIVVTGCTLADTPAGFIENVALFEGRIARVAARRLDSRSVGTGDLFTGIVTAGLAMGRDFEAAVRLASDTLSRVLGHAARAGEPHMLLGSAMAELLSLRDNG